MEYCTIRGDVVHQVEITPIRDSSALWRREDLFQLVSDVPNVWAESALSSGQSCRHADGMLWFMHG